MRKSIAINTVIFIEEKGALARKIVKHVNAVIVLPFRIQNFVFSLNHFGSHSA